MQFDQSWANAYNRFMGQHYYPKLQSCVPFTPVTGRRLLVKQGAFASAVTEAMAQALQQIADQMGVSSLHMTFSTQQEWEEMGAKQGYLQRAGIQVGRGHASLAQAQEPVQGAWCHLGLACMAARGRPACGNQYAGDAHNCAALMGAPACSVGPPPPTQLSIVPCIVPSMSNFGRCTLSQGCLLLTQYWWVNQGYESFDDYLMHLRQSKRKNIRQVAKVTYTYAVGAAPSSAIRQASRAMPAQIACAPCSAVHAHASRSLGFPRHLNHQRCFANAYLTTVLRKVAGVICWLAAGAQTRHGRRPARAAVE